jgi:hypothetical protein
MEQFNLYNSWSLGAVVVVLLLNFALVYKLGRGMLLWCTRPLLIRVILEAKVAHESREAVGEEAERKAEKGVRESKGAGKGVRNEIAGSDIV